jgi:hypothetical protein
MSCNSEVCTACHISFGWSDKKEQIGVVAYGMHEERKMYTELLGIPEEKMAL